MFKKAIFISLLIPTLCFAISENVLLWTIASNTASELARLSELLKVAEEQAKKMEEYHMIADDYVMMADRLEMWAEDIHYISTNSDITDLRSLNDAISDVKSAREDLEVMYQRLDRNFQKSKKNTIKNNRKVQNRKLQTRYKAYATKSLGTLQSKAVLQTARNTGASVYEQSKTNSRLDEISEKMDNLTQQIGIQNKMMANEKVRNEKVWGSGI
jgi:hypothetical protein